MNESTATSIAAAVAARNVSAEQVVRDHLDVIQRCDGRVNAMITVQADDALAAARAVDAALARGEHLGPLAGVPVVIKDNICTTHAPTTCGSRILQGYRSPYAAHVVHRLQSAGAVVLGKANLDEFAMGSSCENSAWFPTRNPWATDRVAGGSSGGSCAAVSAGMAACAMGSDTGGSIRLPAAFTGVTGLKPTYGRVSRYGLVAYGSSLDQIGPIARTVQDAALLLSVIAGHDPRDATSADEPVPDYPAHLGDSIDGLRIGVAAEYFGEGLNDEVRRRVEQAIDTLCGQGATMVEIELPNMRHAVAAYYVLAMAEASSNLARYDGVHFGKRAAQPADLIELYSRSRDEALGAEVKRRIMLGTFVLSSGYYDAYYKKASQVRTLVRREFESAFQRCDLVASPVAPTTAFAVGEKTDDPLAMYLTDIYTLSANLAGLPAISVPCGFDAAGLPIGCQLTAPWFDEQRLLTAANAYQRVTDFHFHQPALA